MKKLALILVLFATPAFARPKIGIALGGGGARGAAHVGVLRELERMQVPIDYVAGTSMGAVVGGLYASGMSVDEIEQALTTTDWADALNDRTPYKDLTFRRKEDESRTMTAFEAGVKGGHIQLPNGLRSGQKLQFMLQSHLIPVAGIHDFNKLPIPFNAVAADIESGDAVILDHGDLADAIRASMSIPGVFSPVEMDGKLLVDGGVAMNVPVDAVRNMGADIVIAVDVSGPALKREQLGSMFAVMSQTLTILTQKNVKEQLAKADIVLAPPVAEFATMDFESAGKIIAVGAAYAEEQSAKLNVLSDANAVAVRTARDSGKRTIDYLSIEGSKRVDQRIIRSKVSTKPGRPLDGERLYRDITSLYGLDDFQSVTFSVRDDDGQRGLLLNLQDKPWGPTYMRFGLNITNDLKGDSSYNVLASLTKTRMNRLGAEWRNDIRLGHDLGFTSEFYQPIDYRGRFFVAPSIQYLRNTFSYYDNRKHTADYQVDQFAAVLDAGMQLDDWGVIQGGVFKSRVHATLSTGQLELPHETIDLGGIHGALTIVRTDSPTIPHQGGVVAVRYTASRSEFGAVDAYSRLSTNSYFAYTRGAQTFMIGGGAGTNLGTHLPVYDEFQLGGLLNLSGFAVNEMHGQRYALGRIGTYRRVHSLSSDIGGGVYAGVFFEAGNAWNGAASMSDIHESLTLLLGADTIIGPVLFGYAGAETGDRHFYITIGKTF